MTWKRELCSVALCLIAISTSASADTIEWVGYQNDCTGTRPDGSFFHGDNWFNYVVPDSTDEAIFGSGFDPADDGYPTYLYFGDTCIDVVGCPNPVYIPGGAAKVDHLFMQHGEWTFDFGYGQIGGSCSYDTDSGSLNVGHLMTIGSPRSTAGGPGVASLEILGGTLEIENEPDEGFLRLGASPGSEGTLYVRDDAVLRTPNIILGDYATGHLVLDPGSFVSVSKELRIALGSGSEGTVDISGPWTELLARYVFLGGWPFQDGPADGSVTVDSAGRLAIIDFMTIGWGHPDASGDLVVTGSGSEVLAGNDIEIGYDGTGTADLSSNAYMETFDLMEVGTWGDGTLNVRSSSAARDSFGLQIGVEATGIGLVEIDDGAYDGGLLQVGIRGSGEYRLENGGTGVHENIFVGSDPGSEGSLVVTDPGTELTPGTLMVVGLGGTGTLTVSNGGTILSDPASELRIGQQYEADGEVVVSGPNTNWTGLNYAAIGGWYWGDTPATGSLSVLDGAQMDIAQVSVGNGNAAAAGSIHIQGNGAQLSCATYCTIGDLGDGGVVVGDGGTLSTSNLAVGSRRTGTLEVQAGGFLADSGLARVGSQSGSYGELDINGGNASFAPHVGDWGNGTLRILAGGDLVVPGGTQSLFGITTEGVGDLVMSGPGSTLATTDLTVIGVSGDGTGSISDGAAFYSNGSDVRIAQQDGSIASVVIDAASWTGMNGLSVGGWTFGTTPADGSLTLRNAAVVDGAYVVFGNGNEDAVGTVLVEDEDTVLDASQWLIVGDEGQGTLTIDDLALVHAPGVEAGPNGGQGQINVSNGGQLTSDTTIRLGGEGTGVLLLDGGTVTCTTLEVLEGGCLAGEGTIVGDIELDGGKISPGDSQADPTGLIAVDGDLDVGNEAPELAPAEIDVGGTTPGDDHDQIGASGNVTLGGNLVIRLLDGYDPAAGDTITVLEYASNSSPLRGQSDFDCFTGLDFGDSLSLARVVTSTEYSLVVGVPSGNGVPVAMPDSASTPADLAIVIDVIENDSDPDDDDVRVFSVDTEGTAGTVEIESDHTVRYEPDPEFLGTDTFTYFVTDCNGGGHSATVVVEVGVATDVPELPEVERELSVAPGVQLRSISPNPSFGNTEILWSVSNSGRVELAIYDVRGKRIALLESGARELGKYATTWSGSDDRGRALSAGVYFARLSTSHARVSRRIVLIR